MTMEYGIGNRKRVLNALASMPATILAERYSTIAAIAPAATRVRGPDIGTVMVRGRIGGGGAPFNLGETSVTRATVTLDSGEIGHSLVLGREPDKAAMVAHLDALAQLPDWHGVIEADVVAPAIALQAEARRQHAEETEATRVDFFTLVRGEDR